jgi:hypothetical protein
VPGSPMSKKSKSQKDRESPGEPGPRARERPDSRPFHPGLSETGAERLETRSFHPGLSILIFVTLAL